MPGDSHGDTMSLTYQELADRLGIDVQSARRRVLRAGWAKAPGNDGKARVFVPVTVLPAAGTTTAATVPLAGAPPAVPVVATSEALSHLLSQVAETGELRDRVGRLEGEAKGLREALAHERDAAERLRAELDQAEQQREEARVRAATAEGEAKGLREALAEARRPFWRRWLGGAALCAGSILLPAVASAQVEPASATWIMPGCRAAIAEPRSRPADYDQGLCTGIVRGISYVDLDMCAPGKVTLGQMLRVVVRYIDMRPERQHENFVLLALEALRAAWPCRR